MAKYTKAGSLSYCQFCGERMKIAESINNRDHIMRYYVCKSISCGKETYWTKELHMARLAAFDTFEQQRNEARIKEQYPNMVSPNIIPREVIFPVASPVIEHSYEKALTPVEPPSLPTWAVEQERVQKQRGRRYDALRAEGLSQAEASEKVNAETDEEVAAWDAEAEFAKNVAQNLKYNTLKKRYDKHEIDFDEFDRLKRELDEG